MFSGDVLDRLPLIHFLVESILVEIKEFDVHMCLVEMYLVESTWARKVNLTSNVFSGTPSHSFPLKLFH